jgi:hypothetical protein
MSTSNTKTPIRRDPERNGTFLPVLPLEQRKMVFGNRVLRRTFGPKRGSDRRLEEIT